MCSDVSSVGITIIALKLSVYVERKDIGKNIYPERSFYWGKKKYIYIYKIQRVIKHFRIPLIRFVKNSIQFQSNGRTFTSNNANERNLQRSGDA